MTLTALLLAGGLSQRMGADKATLSFSGEPLWARQLRLLRDLKPDALWVSARTRPTWCPPDIETIFDLPPSSGPLSGLAAALCQLQTSHLLALAIDLPQMNLNLLQQLCTLAQPGCGVVPLHNQHFEPLCAIYPREALEPAETAMAHGQFSLQHLCRDLLSKELVRSYPVPSAEAALFQNVNTPEEFSRCIAADATQRQVS